MSAINKQVATSSLADQSLASLMAIFDSRDVVLGDDALPYAVDESRALTPQPSAVVFPRTHEQVVDLMHWARSNKVPLVPSGGRTGLSGGACAGANEVVVSMEKMNRILDFDPISGLVRVEAGVVLETLQEYCTERGWYYPVDYASKGSAQMGGAVATNAGGIRVLKFGMTRDWVAGIKAVDGTGETLDIDRCLVKDNSGYSVKDLLVGSEGTLAIVTEITFRLTRPLEHQHTLLVGIHDLDHMVDVFGKARNLAQMNAAEFFSESAVRVVTELHGLKSPFHEHYPFYLLLEYDEAGLDIDTLAEVFDGLDVIVSRNEKQKEYIWSLREWISSSINAQKPYKNDVACRISHIKEWLHDLESGLNAVNPAVNFIWFGHLGDGNVHINVLPSPDMARVAFDVLHERFDQVISEIASQYHATISAEHGVGVLKKDMLPGMLSDAEMTIYRKIKRVFDPDGILNPGKLFDG
ncbi:putative FAD-linked oxidoreductase [BD1-7 clade bacterium]|uniref:Putative FAD-linked oxidoreductase n=1 Tax=BD1-7 clade bacterium TaxID=2029982 RepID=A0A5S9N0G0_9GAMM|nr:putative FAD-linked oxidoreductase [BD1-7 clade bacterium]